MPTTRATRARRSMKPETAPSELSSHKRAPQNSSQQPDDVYSSNDTNISIAVRPIRPKNKKRRSSESPNVTTDFTSEPPKKRKARSQPRIVPIEEHPTGIGNEPKASLESETPRRHDLTTYDATDDFGSNGDSPRLARYFNRAQQSSTGTTKVNSRSNYRVHAAISTAQNATPIPQPDGAPPTPVTPHVQQPSPPSGTSPWLARLFGTGRWANFIDPMDTDIAPIHHAHSNTGSILASDLLSSPSDDRSPWLAQQQQGMPTTSSNARSDHDQDLPQTPVSMLKNGKLRATSMPPDLSRNEIETPSSALRNLHLTPLRTVLDQRIKSRLQGSRKARLNRGKHISVASDEHEDLLVLDTIDKLIHVTSGVHTQAASPEHFSSSSNTQRNLHREGHEYDFDVLHAAQTEWELERQRFEQTVLSLSRDANEAKVRLTILEIELQALGFGDASISSTVIIESVRESISRIRETLVAILPESISEDMSTRDFILLLVSHAESLTTSMRRQSLEVSDKNTLIQDLGRQIQGLLDHLAEVEIRKATLQQQWRGMDATNENQSRDIEDLENQLSAVHAERDELKVQLDIKLTDITSLGEENTTLVQSVEKLTASLEGYRAEENRLIMLITRMEDEHRNELQRSSRKHEKAMKELDVGLDRASSLFADTERQSEQRFAELGLLQQKYTVITEERDMLRRELAALTARNEKTATTRVELESNLITKDEEFQALLERLEALHQEMNELVVQMDGLRDNHTSERRQREAAEADLDVRNNDIANLNARLQNHGIQANELRQKLFQVQQQHDSKIKELQSSIDDREERYQTDIAQEVAWRENANRSSDQRAATILELEKQIEAIEQQMRSDLEERDDRIGNLESSMASIRNKLQVAETTYEKEMNEERKHGDDLEAVIVGLEETISRHEACILDLEQEATAATSAHELQLEGLNATISELRVMIVNLEAERDSLEGRVEEEAEQMLLLQNGTTDEIHALRKTFVDKQEKIRNVEEKAAETDRHWQEVVGTRDAEIIELQNSAEEGTEEITTITTEFNLLKNSFSQYISKTNELVANMQAALANVANAKAEVDDEARTLRLAGETMLSNLESVDIVDQVQISKPTRTPKQSSSNTTQRQLHSSGHSKTRSGHRGQRDSGVGLIGDGSDWN